MKKDWVDSLVRQSDIATRFENLVYQAIISDLQSLENRKMILGNAHHISQEIADYAKKIIWERLERSGR